MYAIEINDVTVSYENVCALEKVSLEVEEKQFLGIIGPNGGGKTTLLKVILGLEKPISGSVKIFGKNIEKNRGKLGYVPQASNFDRRFPINVMDVVLMGKLNNHINFFHKYSSKDLEFASEILESLDIYELKDRQIGQLSGGQLQRVLIARGLAVEPEILLLDEPTASIDAKSTNQIYNLLKDLNQEKTIIVVTHDMSAVSSFLDSIACLNKEMFYHRNKELSSETIDKVYGCPIDLIAHGVPHRVFRQHKE